MRRSKGLKGLQGPQGHQGQRKKLTRPSFLVLAVLAVLAVLWVLSSAAASDPDEALVERARARGRELAGSKSWSPADVQALLALQLVDPERFVSDVSFRAHVLTLLPRVLDPAVPPALRDDLLLQLNQVRGIDFAASEAVESAWAAVPRRSADRETPAPAALRFDDESERPLAASIYSLPSFFFDAATADAFLSAVRRAAPQRTLIVLTDLPLHRAFAERARALDVRLLETYGRPYSPWPRDPFSFVRRPDGGLLLLVRPNLQRGREEDAHLGGELIQNLPDDLDRSWKGLTWATAPVPFHNGQILPSHDAVWITLHTLEPRILALLGTDRVPVESFGTAAGLDLYVGAARRASGELAALYGRPVRFVHPLPGPGTPLAERRDLMRRLGGGAGYDLDSLVTLLPAAPGSSRKPSALIADLGAGRKLLAHLPAAEWGAFRTGYGLAPEGADVADVAAALTAAQDTGRAAALAGFLDLTADHLAASGFQVRRLPVLRMPYALLSDRTGLPEAGPDAEFLVTWNNVVVETRDGAMRAEGFSSLLPSGDQAARDAFASSGARLDLFPPLVHSVVLNGGYRCASSHVRAGLNTSHHQTRTAGSALGPTGGSQRGS